MPHTDVAVPIFGGGGFGKGPFPGQESLRVPFVDLFIDGIRIPLLDANHDGRMAPDPETQEIPDTNTLLLLNFNYSIIAKIGGANDVSIDILDPQSNYLTSILAKEDQTQRQFSFQFGWRGINDQVNSRRINVHLLGYSVTQECGFQGAKINIRGIDETYKLYTQTITGEFPITTRIDAAIRQVLTRVSRNFVPVIDSISVPVGEEFSRIDAGSTPLSYIGSLLTVANSARGPAEFISRVVPITDGKIRIEILAKTPEKEIVRKYLFHREKDGRVISFTVQVPGIQLMASAGLKVSATAVDPRTKEVINVTSTQKEDARGEGRRPNTTPDLPTAVYQVPWSNVGQLQGFTKGMRERSDSVVFDAEAIIYGDADLIPLTQISMVVLKSQVPGRIEQGSDIALVNTSGVYRIDRVEHTITAGVFRTTLQLWKNSGLLGSSSDGRPVLLDARVLDASLSIDAGGRVLLSPEALA